jgi:demethylmacrocin O-methyltransferase
MSGAVSILPSLSQERLEIFEDAFKKYNTDKFGYHTYSSVYASLFDKLEDVKDILEMGIHLGASLRAWRDIFPNAKVVGLENNTQRFFTEERITSFYVDQAIDETFENFINFIEGRQFEFIVDDGSHLLRETHNTFVHLLPLLKVDGWFVVEDIKSEYKSIWNDIASSLDDNYIWEIIDMNDLANTNGDNILLVVKRIK